jgi:AbiJ N-terminal domain 4
MAASQCKAKTQSGKECKNKPGASGYCSTHDPAKIAEREAEQKLLARKSRFEIPTRTFSQRRGLKSVANTLQVEDMNVELRNSLWNVLQHEFLLAYGNSYSWNVTRYYGSSVQDFFEWWWSDCLKLQIDQLTECKSRQVDYLRKIFEKGNWYEVLDCLELIVNYFESPSMVENLNVVLERELSGFRFVGGVFIDITTEQEIEMLEEALSDPEFYGSSKHLQRALELLSDRKNPDYRNSIKESISAVESLCKEIVGKPNAELGEALKTLESSKHLHGALKGAFMKLYAYTSDEDGIRHAMLEEPDLTAADAKFFLLSCTSFINYLKSKL